jgi:hypothetical protein
MILVEVDNERDVLKRMDGNLQSKERTTPQVTGQPVHAGASVQCTSRSLSSSLMEGDLGPLPRSAKSSVQMVFSHTCLSTSQVMKPHEPAHATAFLRQYNVVIIILYRETFIGNADKKCRHGGGGKRKRRRQSGGGKAVKRRRQSTECVSFYFISTASTIYTTLVLIVKE